MNKELCIKVGKGKNSDLEFTQLQKCYYH